MKLDNNPLRPINQLLRHRRRRPHLLPLPQGPLPLDPNLRHTLLHRRPRRHLRIRPHHRRQPIRRLQRR
jgi:hypothetical protein